jgi:hypothetical protein
MDTRESCLLIVSRKTPLGKKWSQGMVKGYQVGRPLWPWQVKSSMVDLRHYLD